MPLWLRNFTFKKIQEHYEGEQQANQKAQGKGTSAGNIKETRDLLKKAASQDPRTKFKGKTPYMANPDFATVGKRPSKK